MAKAQDTDGEGMVQGSDDAPLSHPRWRSGGTIEMTMDPSDSDWASQCRFIARRFSSLADRYFVV